MAAILDDLKTEHAQAAVDDRRALKALAETMGAAAFDASAAQAATKQRLESLERLQASVVEALERLHALLEPDQRGRLEHLMRTGAIVL